MNVKLYYLGNLPVTSIYLGDILVWSGSITLPLNSDARLLIVDEGDSYAFKYIIVSGLCDTVLDNVDRLEGTVLDANAVMVSADNVAGMLDSVECTPDAYGAIILYGNSVASIVNDSNSHGLPIPIVTGINECDIDVLYDALTTGYVADAMIGNDDCYIEILVGELATGVGAGARYGDHSLDITAVATYAATSVAAIAKIGSMHAHNTAYQSNRATAVSGKSMASHRSVRGVVVTNHVDSVDVAIALPVNGNVDSSVLWSTEDYGDTFICAGGSYKAAVIVEAGYFQHGKSMYTVCPYYNIDITAVATYAVTSVSAIAKIVSRNAHNTVYESDRATALSGKSVASHRSVRSVVVTNHFDRGDAFICTLGLYKAAVSVEADDVRHGKSMLIARPDYDITDSLPSGASAYLNAADRASVVFDDSDPVYSYSSGVPLDLSLASLDTTDPVNEDSPLYATGITLACGSADITEDFKLVTEAALSDGYSEYLYEPPVWVGNKLLIRSIHKATPNGVTIKLE